MNEKVTALLLFATAFLVTTFTIPHYGITWDEPGYVAQSKRIRAWFNVLVSAPHHAITEKVIDSHWPVWKGGQAPREGDDVVQDRLNPPFAIMLGACVGGIFDGFFGDFFSHRIIGAFSYAVIVAVIFLLAWREGGHVAGLSSAFAFALLPRIFAHAHIFATDLPAAALILLAVYFLSKPSTVFNVICGALFLGMAISTKFTSLIVPSALLVWAAVKRDKRMMVSFIVAALFALIFMVFFYPGLWHDTLNKIKLFLILSSQRSKYIAIPTYYFGKVYWFWLPWHHPWVMVFGTIPMVISGLFFVGAWCVISGKEKSEVARFSLFIFAVFMFSFMAPNAPGHDGMRLFIPAVPFLTIIVGGGFKFLWNKIDRKGLKVFLSALTFLPGIWGIISWHPYELSYYGLLLGGARGAKRLGMETTYWGDVLTSANEDEIRMVTDGSPKTFSAFCEPIAWRVRRGRLGEGALVTSDFPYWTLMFGREGIMNDFERLAWEWGSPRWEKKKNGVRLIALFESGSMYEGIQEKLDALSDDEADKWYYLGLLAEARNAPNEALVYFRKALSLNIRHERALIHLGRAFRELGKHENAVSIFEKIVEKEGSAESYVELARSYTAAGDINKALDAYKKALEIHLNYPFALDEYIGLTNGNWKAH